MQNANAAVAPAVARIAATMAGPMVKFTSIVTASSANAVLRSSSRSKRWRQKVRVRVVIGEAKAPARAAQASLGDRDRAAARPRGDSRQREAAPALRGGRGERGPGRSLRLPDHHP